jgi:hypothetical protein
MTLTETEIGLLQKTNLLLRQLQLFTVLFLLQPKQALALRFHVLLDPKITDRTRTDRDPFQPQVVRNLDTAPCRMLQGESDNLSRRRPISGKIGLVENLRLSVKVDCLQSTTV